MTHPEPSTPSLRESAAPRIRLALWWELVLPLAAYAIVAFLVGLKQSERLNPDGVCYLRLAGYLAAGDWQNAISTYWSPLFAWSMSPLLWLGVEGLDAARLAQIFWGGCLLAAFWWFLRGWTQIPSWGRAVAMLLLVLPVVDFEIFVVAPDVPLAACLLLYFAALAEPGWRQSTAGLLRIGMLGGIAYWAKAYALPFVLLHLPLSIVLLSAGENFPRRLRSAMIALLGFAIPVSLWIAALTWKTGAPTIGSSGPINHAVVGPPDVVRYHPVVFGVPTPPHVSIWETPEKLPYQFWSPLHSPEYRQHQLRVVANNAERLAVSLADFDRLWLAAIMFALLIPLGWLLRRNDGTRLLLWWTAGTSLLYLGGYLLVAFEARYANSLLLPLLLAAWCQVIFTPALRASVWLRPLALAVLAGSLLWRWIPPTVRNLTVYSPPYMRELADSLRTLGFSGPFASTSWYHGLALAYFTGQATVGFPPDADPVVCAQRIRDSGADWLIVWDMGVYPAMPVQDMYPPTIPRAATIVRDESGWKLRKSTVVSFGGREAKIYAFQRVKPATP